MTIAFPAGFTLATGERVSATDNFSLQDLAIDVHPAHAAGR